MQIDWTRKLKNLDGSDLSYGPKNEPATLKDVALDALLMPVRQGQPEPPGTEKARRYVLSTRIYSNPKNVDLDVKDIDLIKDLIGNLPWPLVVGQAYDLIEHFPIEVKEEKE